MYLENIFASSDIKSKLKDESVLFDQVDKYFQKQMGITNKFRLLTKCVKDVTSQKDWRKYKDALSTIQKALDKLLEEKRHSFPRFYFLSNDELLEILSKSNDMEAI